MTQPVLTRRNALLSGLFGSGYLGLKALATGLPVWFLANPRKATAEDLECAIQAKDNLQYLIMNVSSMGDPMSCNCPGTYDGDAMAAIHPQDTTMAPIQMMLGSQSYTAATPWGTLLPAALGRTNFFHHVTLANNHGDQAKVSRLMGATTGGEMLVSAYAKILAGCLGTVQPEPVALAAGTTATELISYEGRTNPAVSPTQLRQLLTGSSGSSGFGGGGIPGGKNGGSAASVLVALRPIRDTYMNKLNDLAKQDSTGVQSKFLDALANSQTQVRSLKDTLGNLLMSITGDDVQGQAYAAAALIAANVTPVVTVKIDFGGDNHSDSNLANETAAHTDSKRGVAGINMILQALANNGLQDKVTFSTLNVFGRNLNGIDKTESRAGRDHYGNHAVAVMIGKNVAPGITGGVTNVSSGFGSTSAALGAGDIDSSTGLVAPSGGDVARLDTHVAMARTLGAALGIPQSQMDTALVQGGTGKVIPSTVVSVPTG